MSKKLIIAIATLAVVAAAGAYGTIAFFSDNETSSNNTFVAGSIDLKVADTMAQITQDQTTDLNGWSAADLTTQKFFDFSDLKPGDWGKDTIELTVESNPAYVCGNIAITAKNENGINDPEIDANDNTADQGELQKYLDMYVWVDTDCDGIKDANETEIINGKINDFESASTYLGIVEPSTPTAAKKTCISKKWCFGNWNEDKTACDGSGDQNDAQTDSLVGDISFYAVQTRHNTQPDCTQIQW